MSNILGTDLHEFLLDGSFLLVSVFSINFCAVSGFFMVEMSLSISSVELLVSLRLSTPLYPRPSPWPLEAWCVVIVGGCSFNLRACISVAFYRDWYGTNIDHLIVDGCSYDLRVCISVAFYRDWYRTNIDHLIVDGCSCDFKACRSVAFSRDWYGKNMDRVSGEGSEFSSQFLAGDFTIHRSQVHTPKSLVSWETSICGGGAILNADHST